MFAPTQPEAAYPIIGRIPKEGLYPYTPFAAAGILVLVSLFERGPPGVRDSPNRSSHVGADTENRTPKGHV